MKFELPDGWAPGGRLNGRRIDLVSEFPGLDRMTWPSVEVDIDGIGWSRPFRHGIPDDLSFDDELEDHGHPLLLQAPRNVRAHLNEGLQVVDEIVEQLRQATPDAMGDVTGEVKRILAKAGDYAEARTMLEQSFPTLDRAQLRNMLTGGMLIAQATGMQTVQQEVDGGRSAANLSLSDDEIEEIEDAGDGGYWLLAKKAGKGMIGSGWITVNGTHVHAEPGKKIDFKNLKTSGGGHKTIPVATTTWTKERLSYQPPAPDAENLEIKSFDDLPTYKAVAGRTPNGQSEDEFSKESLGVSRKMSKDQRDAIKRFSGEEYTTISAAQRAKSADEFADNMIAAARRGDPIPPRLKDDAQKGNKAGLKPSYERAKKDGDHIESALSSVQKSPGKVYRGMSNISSEHVQHLMSNNTFEMGSLSSTSRSMGVSDVFFAGGRQSALFVLHQKSGVAIESVSTKKGEKEILLPKGSRFKITKRYQRDKSIGGNVQKQIVIEAIEID